MTRQIRGLAVVLACLQGLNCAAHRVAGGRVHQSCENACSQDHPLCVSGLVTDEAGRPLPEFNVGAFKSDDDWVNDMPFATTETDSEGRYTFVLPSVLSVWRISRPPGPFRILAIQPGYVITVSPLVSRTPACVDLVVERAPTP